MIINTAPAPIELAEPVSCLESCAYRAIVVVIVTDEGGAPILEGYRPFLRLNRAIDIPMNQDDTAPSVYFADMTLTSGMTVQPMLAFIVPIKYELMLFQVMKNKN